MVQRGVWALGLACIPIPEDFFFLKSIRFCEAATVFSDGFIADEASGVRAGWIFKSSKAYIDIESEKLSLDIAYTISNERYKDIRHKYAAYVLESYALEIRWLGRSFIPQMIHSRTLCIKFMYL